MKIPFTQSELVFQAIKPEPPSGSIKSRFAKFHSENPSVYACLVSLARQFRYQRPDAQVGIGMLYEVLRWNHYMEVNTNEEYKLCNDFRAPYARLIMEQEPELKGIFKMRFSVVD